MRSPDEVGPTGVATEYHAYGEGVQMFRWLTGELQAPYEAMFEGVAGCGKTRMAGEWIKSMCNMYPDSVGLVLRKTRVSLNESFLEIWENEVLGATHPAVLTGPTRAHRYEYNHPLLGGRVVLGGMDNPVRLFSTQYNWCYVNELQELTEAEWESLHRALRRRGGPPFRVLIGDCNPEDEYHWANQRAINGKLHRIIGRFTDNPSLTPEYLQRLKNSLTGVRYQRLFLGRWASAEGMIYEDFNKQKHVLTGTLTPIRKFDQETGQHLLHVQGWTEPVYLRWYIGAMDFGYEAPGCFQIWGIDDEKRMYLVAEVYRSKWDLDQWAGAMQNLYEDFPFRYIVCDSAEPRSIKFLNDRLGPMCAREVPRIAIEAEKHASHKGKSAKLNGFNQVRWLLKEGGDNKPRIFWLRDCLRFGKDPKLEGKARNSIEEISAYVYTRIAPGKVLTQNQREDSDKACADHAMDAMRYAATFVWGKDWKPQPEEHKYEGGTYGALFGDAETLHKETMEQQWRKRRWAL